MVNAWSNPPSEMDYDIIGRPRVRLDVPFLSQKGMAESGALLVALGQMLIRLSMQGAYDFSERSALLNGRAEAHITKRRLFQHYQREVEILEERRKAEREKKVTAIRR